jgi:small subunit ribosomal protein S3
MGQKINPNVLRLHLTKTNWKSKYYAKTSEESTVYLFNTLEIKKYLNRIFQLHGLIVQKFNLSYTTNTLKIFVPFFLTLKYFKTRTKIKKFSLKTNYNFTENLLESLTVFTKKKVAIVLVLNCLNTTLRLTNQQLLFFKKNYIKLRKLVKLVTFKETLNVIVSTLRKKNSSKLLAEFIAFQVKNMKKQTFFISLLKQLLTLFLSTKLFSTKGIKIIIKGRINGRPRTRTNTILIGNLPIQTFKANINYNNITTFTRYGTFGIKVWVHENNYNL